MAPSGVVGVYPQIEAVPHMTGNDQILLRSPGDIDPFLITDSKVNMSRLRAFGGLEIATTRVASRWSRSSVNREF